MILTFPSEAHFSKKAALLQVSGTFQVSRTFSTEQLFFN